MSVSRFHKWASKPITIKGRVLYGRWAFAYAAALCGGFAMLIPWLVFPAIILASFVGWELRSPEIQVEIRMDATKFNEGMKQIQELMNQLNSNPIIR